MMKRAARWMCSASAESRGLKVLQMWLMSLKEEGEGMILMGNKNYSFQQGRRKVKKSA